MVQKIRKAARDITEQYVKIRVRDLLSVFVFLVVATWAASMVRGNDLAHIDESVDEVKQQSIENQKEILRIYKELKKQSQYISENHKDIVGNQVQFGIINGKLNTVISRLDNLPDCR